MAIQMPYTVAIRVADAVDEARSRVEAALRAEGFGVLTEIDIAATLRAKLGIEQSPYLILGACNPTLAHRALAVDPSIGAFLPCNVVLRADDTKSGAPGGTIVEAIDPLIALGVADGLEIHDIAIEAHERLLRAIVSLATDEETRR